MFTFLFSLELLIIPMILVDVFANWRGLVNCVGNVVKIVMMWKVIELISTCYWNAAFELLLFAA